MTLDLKISIITVCYNASKTIEKTIQSILSQSYTNIEYIVIDGLSKDNTMEIVNAYKNKINTIVSEKDNGLYDALNKGLSFATGDIIGFLHADDFYTNKNVIKDIASCFINYSVDACYSNLNYVNNKNKIVRKWIAGKYFKNQFLYGWMPPHPTVFIKKECYTKFGNFRLDCGTAADYELMLRFFYKNKLTLSYINKNTVNMLIGGSSNAQLKNRIQANKNDKKAWQINGLNAYWFTTYLKPLRKIFQYIT